MFTMDQIDATHTAYRMGIEAGREVSATRISELEEKAKKAKFMHKYEEDGRPFTEADLNKTEYEILSKLAQRHLGGGPMPMGEKE
jgi:hypothetical protein